MTFGCRSTSSTGANAERSEAGAARLRPLSYCQQRRDHCPNDAQTADHERRALPSEAEHEDRNRRAAIAVPSGTPVCLMENVSASLLGCARQDHRARRCGRP
jgi:hypothetical protein